MMAAEALINYGEKVYRDYTPLSAVVAAASASSPFSLTDNNAVLLSDDLLLVTATVWCMNGGASSRT